MKQSFRLLAAIPALLLAACATTPASRYFSLVSPQNGQSASGRAAASQAIAIHLQPVGLPAQVDRPQIVLSRPDSDALLLLNGSVRAAPLAAEIRQALSLSLADRLDALSIDGMRAPQGLAVWTIGFTVNRFEMRNGDGATLEATWRLSPPSATTGARFCRAMATQPVDTAGVEPLVEAQKALLERFSQAIASSVKGEALSRDAGLQSLRCSTASAAG